MRKKNKEEVVNEVELSDYLKSFRPHIIEFSDFQQENYLNLIHDLNESTEYPNREVYLKSQGGDGSLVEPIINLIEKSGVRLIASSYIYSSAFLTFFQAKCEKEIVNNTHGMFHYPYITTARLLPNGAIHHDKGKLDKFLLKDAKYYNEELFKELLDITEKKHKFLQKGGELVFNTDELKKILKKSNKILGL